MTTTKKISNEELVARIRAGQDIKTHMQQLYNENLPLIRKFIKPFLPYEEEADLLQQAYFGLHRATQMFESSENVRFMTYSKFWIQQEVRRYLENNGSLIRIPSHKKQQGIQYKRFLQEYEREYGRPPSDLEAAEDLGVSLDELTKIKISIQGVSSLDMPLKTGKADDEISLGDTIADRSNLEDDVVDEIFEEQRKATVWRIVEDYTDAQQEKVIRLYFKENKTLSEIAEETGVSLERIRQIKASGLRQLRRGKALRELEQKCEILESSVYRTGFNSFKQYGSSVEKIAIRREELLQKFCENPKNPLDSRLAIM